MIRGFAVFGKIIVAIITIGLAAALVESLTGLVLIPGMAPISEGLSIVGDIALVLAGAFPLVWAITKVFRKPLMKLGSLLGMNDTGGSRAHCQPGEFHRHVWYGKGHGPAGQGDQRGLRRLCRLRLRRSPGLHRRI